MRSTSSLLLGGTGLSPSAILAGGANLRDPFPAPKRACRQPAVAATRTRLDELHPSLHCSIVGTCFGLRELRQLVVKFGDASLARAGDHTIHTEAVRCATRRDGLGRMLAKALERKFKATIAQVGRATDVAGLRQIWLDAMANGDIPGAYWAVLTHPAATNDFVREAFSDVHMLSHLVGAANRADIRRLQELERSKEELEDKLARQQRHLTETLGAKERQIRELLGMLAERERGTPAQTTEEDLAESLKRERYRRMRLERRIEELTALSREIAEQRYSFNRERHELAALAAAAMEPSQDPDRLDPDYDRTAANFEEVTNQERSIDRMLTHAERETLALAAEVERLEPLRAEYPQLTVPDDMRPTSGRLVEPREPDLAPFGKLSRPSAEEKPQRGLANVVSLAARIRALQKNITG